MPTFTVICGGASDVEQAERSAGQRLFEEFAVVLIQQLTNGNETFRVTASFVRVLEKYIEHKLPMGLVIDAAVLSLHRRLFPLTTMGSVRDHALEQVVRAALCLIAERIASRNFVSRDVSESENDLVRAISEFSANTVDGI